MPSPSSPGSTASPGTAAVTRPEIDERLRLRIADQLGSGFKGEIIGPDQAGYDAARLVWNAMIDRYPGLVLRCTCTADVVAAVNVARAHGLHPAVRGGGHNVAGKAMSDGGLTIDLGGMRNVTVNAPDHLVHVDGGLAGQAIDALVDFWQGMPTHGEVEIIGLGGAMGDVPEDATAFSNRQYLLWLNFAMAWDDPANDSDYIERTRQIVRHLAPWVGKGIYVNMLNFDELDRVVEAFGGPEKYARLGRVKARYDPENLFQMNYNITPVAGDPAVVAGAGR